MGIPSAITKTSTLTPRSCRSNPGVAWHNNQTNEVTRDLLHLIFTYLFMTDSKTLTPIKKILGITKWKKLEHINPGQLEDADLSQLPEETILECAVSDHFRVRIGRSAQTVYVTVKLSPTQLYPDPDEDEVYPEPTWPAYGCQFDNIFFQARQALTDQQANRNLFTSADFGGRVSHYGRYGFITGSNLGADVIPAANRYRVMIVRKLTEILLECADAASKI